MKIQWWKRLSFILATTLVLVVFIKLNGNLSSFINHVQEQDAVYTFMQVNRSAAEKEQLYAQIVAEADKNKIEPINARIDRVFHAIPGYNGIEVDIDKTYEYNLQMVRGEKLKFLYKETEPAVKLENLGNHPIYKGNANKKMIGFMINVAWGNEYLESILKTLEQEQVHATFFLDGTWLSKNKELALKIQDAGHELSNHAYTHPDMAKLGRSEQESQITRTEQLLKEMDVKNKWFAPPSGSFNQTTIQVAREQGLLTVLWTIDTIDWRRPPAATVVTRVTTQLEPGGLVLMHPTISTAEALPEMIRIIKEKGYSIGTVSHTLSSERLQDTVEGVDIF